MTHLKEKYTGNLLMKNYNNSVQASLLNFSVKIPLQNKPRISSKKILFYAFSWFHAPILLKKIAQNSKQSVL